MSPRALLAPFLLLAGCGPGPLRQHPVVAPSPPALPTPSVTSREPALSSRSSILSRTPPETLHIESYSNDVRASCLGVLVAPRVALTASHCVEGRSSARVRLARSAHAGFVAVGRFWSDPRRPKGSPTVDRRSADVSILLLERPIALPSYPKFARRPAPGYIAATGIRRAGDQIETAALTLAPPLGAAYYVSQGFAKPGDSGGAVYFVGSTGDRMVIAVTAGGSEDRELLTRVDLVSEAIDRAIEMGPTG